MQKQNRVPDEGLEEFDDEERKGGRMDNVEGFEVFFKVSIEAAVCLHEPTERRFVRTGESIVKINHGVIHGHVLLQCLLYVP